MIVSSDGYAVLSRLAGGGTSGITPDLQTGLRLDNELDRITLAVGDVIIDTEIMPTPGELHGEWLELHNPGTDLVNLLGLHVLSTGVDSLITADVFVDPGGYAVLAPGDEFDTGGIPVDWVYRVPFYLPDSSAELAIVYRDD